MACASDVVTRSDPGAHSGGRGPEDQLGAGEGGAGRGGSAAGRGGAQASGGAGFSVGGSADAGESGAPGAGQSGSAGHDQAGSAGADGDDCPPRTHEGSALLARQTDVERFEGVTHVEGTLTLTGEVSNLSPLHCLRTVSESLEILGSPTLVDTTGLEAVTSASYVTFGERCTDYTLRTGCVSNERLERVRLSGLRSGSVSIHRGNPVLGAVAFDALVDATEITFMDTSLEVISGFDALESLGGLFVASNPALVRIGSFGAVTAVGELTVLSSPQLEDFDAFAELSHAGNVRIEAPLLTHLQGLGRLETVDALELSHVGLPDLTALSRLTSVEALKLTSNTALTTLAGLEGVTHLPDFELSFSPVEDLGALDSVVGDIDFFGVRATSITDFSPLPLASAVGYFRIEDNAELASIGALDVPSVDTLSLDRNSQLADLGGLAGRANVKVLSISGSETLTSLRDLADQTNIVNLSIFDNSQLPTCEAEWLRDLLDPDTSYIEGNDDAGTCP
jgi:hypothetical protein